MHLAKAAAHRFAGGSRICERPSNSSLRSARFLQGRYRSSRHEPASMSPPDDRYARRPANEAIFGRAIFFPIPNRRLHESAKPSPACAGYSGREAIEFRHIRHREDSFKPILTAAVSPINRPCRIPAWKARRAVLHRSASVDIHPPAQRHAHRVVRRRPISQGIPGRFDRPRPPQPLSNCNRWSSAYSPPREISSACEPSSTTRP